MQRQPEWRGRSAAALRVSRRAARARAHPQTRPPSSGPWAATWSGLRGGRSRPYSLLSLSLGDAHPQGRASVSLPSLHLTPSEARLRCSRVRSLLKTGGSARQQEGGQQEGAQRGCGRRPAQRPGRQARHARSSNAGPASLLAGTGVPSGLMCAFNQQISRPPGAS